MPPQKVEPGRSALGRVVWFAVISIIATIAGWALDFGVFSSSFFTGALYNLPQNATGSQVSAAMGPMFQDTAALVPVIAAIQLTGVAVLATGFRQLIKVDPARFSLPSNLMVVLIAGAAIAAIGAVALLNSLPNAISQAPLSNGHGYLGLAPAFANLLLYAVVIAIGGLLALVGAIGGMILGLWRVGSLYDETMVKMGAIFLIIPLLNILAPILILLGASSARGRLVGVH